MNTRISAALTSAAVTATLVFGTVAQPAHSAEPVVTAPLFDGDTKIQKVSFADLNLRSAAGQKTLERRVNGAVEALCGDRPGFVPLRELLARRECSAESWSNARPQISAAIERARSGQYAGQKAGSIIVLASK